MSRARLLGAALAAALALAPCMPLRGRLPSVDSGVFLYVGWRVTRGELPYRDAWDSKPPGIYYLDAAGLALGGGSEWGVWALQWLFLLGAILVSFSLLEEGFGAPPSFLATGLWVCMLPYLLELGNMTEQYGLTLKFLTLALLARPWTRGRAAAIGALTGGLFLLKQNLVALSAAWALTALLDAPALLLPAALGFLAVVGSVAAYFAARGGASDLWSAAFLFNAVNVTPGLALRAACVFAGLSVAWSVSVPALAGWAWSAYGLARDRKAMPRWVVVCLVALPLELAAAGASGRAFRHYYLAWLPVFAVFIAALVREAAARSAAGMRLAALAAAGLAAAPLVHWAHDARVAASMGPNAVVEYLKRETAPGDAVLAWGVGARYNFAARRESPTRYCIAHPLLRRGYDAAPASDRFLAELRRRPPAVLLDLSRTDVDIPPLERKFRPQWPWNDYYEVPPPLEAPLAWLEARYSPAETIGRVVVWRPSTAVHEALSAGNRAAR